MGPSEDKVFHALTPFYLGGDADVLCFRHHVPGIMYSTADLIGNDGGAPNKVGQYELLIATRKEEDWAPNLISRLAQYTREAVLQPWDTMDIGTALPQPTKIEAFLYVPYAGIEVQMKKCNLLLCLGITKDELDWVRQCADCDPLLNTLKEKKIYPFTDLNRKSVRSNR